MKRGALIAAGVLACVAGWWLFSGRKAVSDKPAVSAPTAHQSEVMAPDVRSEDATRGRGIRIPRKAPVPPIPADRTRVQVAISTQDLSKHDPAAFALVMGGLKGIRPAIRKCVFDLENTVKEPTVLEWPMILDLVTDDDGTTRVIGSSSDEWPEDLPAEMRECFSVAFAGIEFDAGDERFAYKLAYPMAVSVAPPP